LPQCYLPSDTETPSSPVWTVSPDTLAARLGEIGGPVEAFATASGFEATAGNLLVVPTAEGTIAGALFGLGRPGDAARTPFLPGRLASSLPTGDWRIDGEVDDEALAALAFGLEAYRFDRYRAPKQREVRLVLPAAVDQTRLEATVDAVRLVRDLVNTPANDLGPTELANTIQSVFLAGGGQVREIVGDELKRGFPLVEAVGRGSDRPPRVIDATWGASDRPRVTLIGKGVVFDSGGLDIKSDTGMALMKKDMGGAANALALASLIIAARLPVRLRLIVPAVENAVSGRAFRPGDVFPSRKGPTVEIGSTDAEGRLILADALAWADEEAPDLLIDLATLTGAARVALGPDLPPFYTDDEALAAEIAAASRTVFDPLWRMPLWAPYRSMIEGKIADLANSSTGGFAGSITAALFLSNFVEAAKSWVHLDIYAWTPTAKPGRPEGGEAQAIRALFEVIERRYAVTSGADAGA
jgi:leucyl aminopeptidase